MNPVKSGNRAISVQTKGQPLAIVAAVTQAPKMMMPTEISSETTLSMLGCSSRRCRPPSRKIAQPGERNGTLVYLGHHLRHGGDYHRIRGFIRMQPARDSLARRLILRRWPSPMRSNVGIPDRARAPLHQPISTQSGLLMDDYLSYQFGGAVMAARPATLFLVGRRSVLCGKD
jgi:hypothetical protein